MFSISVAQEVGINAAILLENIAFWVQKNAANGKHIHDGRPWTYNSMRAFSELFPYMTIKQIRTALRKLKDEGYILVGNYNSVPYDKTSWYALTEKGIKGSSMCAAGLSDLPSGAHRDDPEGEPIPDITTDINTDITTTTTSGGSDELARVIREWDKATGCVSSMAEGERLVDLFDQYGEEAMLYAIHQAVDHGKVNLAYVNGVLRRAPYTHDLTEEEKRRNREAILNDE